MQSRTRKLSTLHSKQQPGFRRPLGQLPWLKKRHSSLGSSGMEPNVHTMAQSVPGAFVSSSEGSSPHQIGLNDHPSSISSLDSNSDAKRAPPVPPRPAVEQSVSVSPGGSLVENKFNSKGEPLTEKIDSLESLIEEAMSVAQYAEDSNNTKEIVSLVKETNRVLKAASGVYNRNASVLKDSSKISEPSKSFDDKFESVKPLENYNDGRSPKSTQLSLMGRTALDRLGENNGENRVHCESIIREVNVDQPTGSGSPSQPNLEGFSHHGGLVNDEHKDGSHSSLKNPFSEGSSYRNRHHSSRGLNEVGAEETGDQQPHVRISENPESLRYWYHRSIGRNWSQSHKRATATVACMNTALVGLIVGIYAGEVPRIQYQLADMNHSVILGNVYLYLGLAISTFLLWPLPVMHGRKPYILVGLSIALPLQIPQAVMVSLQRSPELPSFRIGLLFSRAISGIALGMVNINCFSTLLDLFGASLQSARPHQEFVVTSDVRRHGGGIGLWLGMWSWSFIGSIALGFQIGAGIIVGMTPSWGFYTTVILVTSILILNIITPETRHTPVDQYIDIEQRYDYDPVQVVDMRGEIRLHIFEKEAKNWREEMLAGVRLSIKMLSQTGFSVLSTYLAWTYCQIILVIVLLGALLSREYHWHPQYVGLGVLSVAIGALLAVPLSKANIFSRARKKGPRTDSMTFTKRVTWTSHFVRRIIFLIALPFLVLAYTLASTGWPANYMIPIVFAGLVGFLSNLAISESIGLVMEAYDTCDLQPGVNGQHRRQSMEESIRHRRTNYSSFPRVSAGIFISQTLSFLFASIATVSGSALTRHIGAQAASGVTAGLLFALTLALIAALWRWKEVQVIPDSAFGTRRKTPTEMARVRTTGDWRPVVIGNPSGKMRKMNTLELGGLSRWSEIRRLNRLIGQEETRRRVSVTI